MVVTAEKAIPGDVRTCCPGGCQQEAARTRFDEERLAALGEMLQALAAPARLRIMHFLVRYQALCVCEIESALDLGQPTISYHLRVLREAALVEVQRRGTRAYYPLARPGVKRLVQELLALV
ncbi:MAG: metalloregulator ArsR/SmtB family transcription factor [Armatimonadota bacterium]|nr:metalloregulator ArsR/SmtB family transcription factor [Armatimonadota bacterium]MDR7426074.1 metalloregulator ArsR/SmtB family transcription factor [Armatimonadota bacterium]MDR7469073.1 metalloregulator ArsR/SmtB family transcription factor [Armatimonadota bacterium]MDR7474275.1 metalloregulator ArsR/SmtB family transcription factor [Armatimonadota bacterium]MDR7539738.1 metalloregulator ArsR/SmtB family transcription factor [Armatimonadota bacterium]